MPVNRIPKIRNFSIDNVGLYANDRNNQLFVGAAG